MTSVSGDQAAVQGQLKSRLSVALKNNGTIDSLKSQLRAKVLLDLRATRGKRANAQALPVSSQAAGLLFMDFLQLAGFMQTASVFSPESGIQPVDKENRPQKVAHLLELLRVDPDSRLGRALSETPDASSLMKVILDHLGQTFGEKKGVGHSSCQTTSATETLEKRFDAIHDRYRSLSHDNSIQPLKSLEERLAQVQREADERVRAEVEAAVGRVRSVEMSKIRMEESAKHARELAQARDELERTWQRKIEQLRGREAEFAEKVRRMEQEAEAQAYQHRQRMLLEMDTMRRRDAQSRKAAEDAEVHMRKQEARVRELEALVERKVADVERTRVENQRRAESEMQRFKADLLREQEAEQRAATAARQQLEEQLLQASMARDAFGDALAEARVAREECAVLQSQVASITSELGAAKESARRAQERVAELGEELREAAREGDRLRERLAEAAVAPEARGVGAGSGEVAEQVAALRASQGRERLAKEKQLIVVQGELKAANREIMSLQHRLGQLQHEHDALEARLKREDGERLAALKSSAELQVELRAARQEAEDARQLLAVSQAALERDRAGAQGREDAEALLSSTASARRPWQGGAASFGAAAAVARGHPAGRAGLYQSQDDLNAEGAQTLFGSRVSARAGAAGEPDAWAMEFSRIMRTIEDLEQEDAALRQNRESLAASRRSLRAARELDGSNPPPARPLHAWAAPQPAAVPLVPAVEASGEGAGIGAIASLTSTVRHYPATAAAEEPVSPQPAAPSPARHSQRGSTSKASPSRVSLVDRAEAVALRSEAVGEPKLAPAGAEEAGSSAERQAETERQEAAAQAEQAEQARRLRFEEQRAAEEEEAQRREEAAQREQEVAQREQEVAEAAEVERRRAEEELARQHRAREDQRKLAAAEEREQEEARRLQEAERAREDQEAREREEQMKDARNREEEERQRQAREEEERQRRAREEEEEERRAAAQREATLLARKEEESRAEALAAEAQDLLGRALSEAEARRLEGAGELLTEAKGVLMEAGIDRDAMVQQVEAAMEQAKEDIKAEEVEGALQNADEAMGRRGDGGKVTPALLARATDCVAEAERAVKRMRDEARFAGELERLREQLVALEEELGSAARTDDDPWGDGAAGSAAGSGESGAGVSAAGSVVEEDIELASFGDSVQEEYSGNFDDDKSADSW